MTYLNILILRRVVDGPNAEVRYFCTFLKFCRTSTKYVDEKHPEPSAISDSPPLAGMGDGVYRKS